MKITEVQPPREFRVGSHGGITLRDCARILLDADEQVTFVTPEGKEYDVARKSWGFYATPSTNGRLREFGWRSALVRSSNGRHNVMLVDTTHVGEFEAYVKRESLHVVCWLDEDAVLAAIGKACER